MGFPDGKQGIPGGSGSATVRGTAVWEAGHTGELWGWRLVHSCERGVQESAGDNGPPFRRGPQTQNHERKVNRGER